MTQSSTSGPPTRTVLLISSGYHLYREYLLRMIARHARVWLLLDRDVGWERPYVVGNTRVNTLDVEAMVAAARTLPDGVVIDGVICWDEIRMVHATRVAEALGLPGGPAGAIANCRDKHRTRTVLAAAGVPQARSVPVSSADEAAAVAHSIGYPVIVKPRASARASASASRTTKASSEAAYAHARDAHEDGVPRFDAGVLVEEYMDGPEISVDAACASGTLTPLFLARKMTGFYPHFEETGHLVDPADPLLTDPRLREVLETAHRAIGLSHRHHAYRAEAYRHRAEDRRDQRPARRRHDPVRRLGGDGRQPRPRRRGCRLRRSSGDQALSRHVAAIRFFYPERDATVVSVSVNDRMLPPAVDVAQSLALPGQRLVLPPNDHVSCRYGYAVVHGATPEACDEAAQAAERAFALVIE